MKSIFNLSEKHLSNFRGKDGAHFHCEFQKYKFSLSACHLKKLRQTLYQQGQLKRNFLLDFLML